MCGEASFEVDALILEVMPNRTCRVVLANGHKLIGFVPGLTRLQRTLPVVGQKVRIRLSPCDLSQGRILLETGRS